MGVDHFGVEALLRHQRGGAMGCALAFAADAENINIVADEVGEIHWHRVRREGGEADPPAAVHHSCRLIEGVRRARAFEDVLHALAMGNPLDSLDRILAVDINDLVRAETLAHFEPSLAGARQDYRLGAQRLGNVLLTGDRGFESISLQRRVSCEPDFLVSTAPSPPLQICA